MQAIERDSRYGSQARFADAMGYTPSYVAQLVGRVTAPGKRALTKLSETLNVSEAWLAYGLGPPTGMTDQLEEMARNGREADAEAWYLRALERIEKMDVADEDRRMLYRDSVASAYGRVGYVLAERAGLERAAAIRAAETAAEARASVVVKREPQAAPVILGTANAPKAEEEEEPG